MVPEELSVIANCLHVAALHYQGLMTFQFGGLVSSVPFVQAEGSTLIGLWWGMITLTGLLWEMIRDSVCNSKVSASRRFYIEV